MKMQKTGVSFLAVAVLSGIVMQATTAHAVRFRLPLSSDTAIHYYYDHNTSSGVTAWNCSGTSYNGHGGSDFSGGPRGRAIFAAASGSLSYKIDGFGDGYAGSPAGGGAGNHVRINHGGGVVSWYAHMTIGSVTGKAIGSGVACGEQVGGVGTSGSSTGLHLHFTVQVNGANRDPFIGGCGGLGWWVNQGSGSPSTTCEGGGGGGKPAEFDPGNAAWYLRNSNTTGGIDNSFYFGIAGDIPVMGDWDGNGSITPGVFRPSTAQWFLRNSNSNGGVDYTFYFGVGSDIPVVGDWDGNGTFTPGVFRPSTAQWYLRNSNSNGGVDHAFAFGAVGDQPIVGDWDGNRTSTPGVFRPSTAAFYLSNTLNGALGGWFYFGAANDSAIAGDWNADGYWTVGVYRNGIRYLSNSNLNPTTDVVFTYGANHNRHLVWR